MCQERSSHFKFDVIPDVLVATDFELTVHNFDASELKKVPKARMITWLQVL